MGEQMTDCKITKVYAGPIGESEHGPWEMWNFYVNNGSDKFTWFGGGKKITPVVGMQIAYMEYEKEAKGKFTNLNVKKLVLKEESTPEAIPNAKEDLGSIPKAKNDSEVSYYVSYMKDAAIGIIAAGRILEDTDLDAIARKIAKAGIVMMNESLYNTQISPQVNKTVPPLEDKTKDKGEGKGSSPQKEENRKLRATLKKYHKADEALFYKTIGLHGAEKGEEVIEFAKVAQHSLLRDLEKAFEEPDF